MKSLTSILSFVLFALFVASTACAPSHTNSSATEPQGKEYTSAYVCPMHCKDSGSEQVGQCPVCGMDYIKNSEHQADGHKH
ncbi:MAG TPA: heavy metal-binding domain-containing protein [Saprospiraceae bacterium]|nr:heavy metal-binding domain-containing protein [Saprospiraceae bacterium]HMQ85597.1 heavy metal-binding domain-containing protein [Saprospiraceae bacterium]